MSGCRCRGHQEDAFVSQARLRGGRDRGRASFRTATAAGVRRSGYRSLDDQLDLKVRARHRRLSGAREPEALLLVI